MESLKDRIELMRNRLEARGVVFADMPVPVYEPYQCAACQDKGVVSYDAPVGDPRFGRMFECPEETCAAAAQRREGRFARLSVASQLPKDYQQWTFDSWRKLVEVDGKRPKAERRTEGKKLAIYAAWAFASRFASGHAFTLSEVFEELRQSPPADLPDTRKNSLMLQGVAGVGKTSLLASVVNYLLGNMQVVVYARTSDVLNAVKERYDRQQQAGYEFDYGNTPEAVKALFKRAPVLALDEFNLAAPTDHERGIMEDIIRFRMMNNLPTIMTCNIDFDTFNNPLTGWDYRIGHAVQGMSHWVVMGGLELRPRNRPVSG